MNEFEISKSQKKVLVKFNKFLNGEPIKVEKMQVDKVIDGGEPEKR